MLQEGDKAPTFNLESAELPGSAGPDGGGGAGGEKIALKDLKGKTVVLYFYPKDLTPGCTQEACDFRDAQAKLKKAGAVVLGVSKDSVTLHQKFIAKHELTFPLLADTDGKVCEAYGVWKEKSLYGRKYMGIERMTFVISPQGKIAKIFPKVRVKGHVDQVLEVIKELA